MVIITVDIIIGYVGCFKKGILYRSTLDSGNIDQEFCDALLILYSQAISKTIEFQRINRNNSERVCEIL